MEQTSSECEVTAQWIGEEREPLVVIDNLAPNPDALREAARQLDFAPVGTYYPGVRAAATEAYFRAVWPTLSSTIREFFGYRRSVTVLRSYYSLMTAPPEELMLAQRIPHTDSPDDNQIAVLHYLCPDHTDGTAFFRHRSTGFETVNEARSSSYGEALEADFKKYGTPEPAYIGSDNAIFEQVHTCDAKYNRALVYRGKMLHCASVSSPELLLGDPIAGRLTVASFIAAQ